MNESRFSTDNLSVGYNNEILINDICINVCPGEIVMLIGPNGSGKSTILKTITNNLVSCGGRVYVDDKEMSSYSANELAKKISVVWTGRVHTELTSCEEIVEMGRYPYTGKFGILSENDHKIVDAAMEVVKIKELKDRDFDTLSDGQKQRVLLARAIAQEPDIMILDEPTSFLDISYKAELFGILKKLAKEEKVSIILSMHELDCVSKVADTVVCVKGDRIFMAGKPQEVMKRENIMKLYDLSDSQYEFMFKKEM